MVGNLCGAAGGGHAGHTEDRIGLLAIRLQAQVGGIGIAGSIGHLDGGAGHAVFHLAGCILQRVVAVNDGVDLGGIFGGSGSSRVVDQFDVIRGRTNGLGIAHRIPGVAVLDFQQPVLQGVHGAGTQAEPDVDGGAGGQRSARGGFEIDNVAEPVAIPARFAAVARAAFAAAVRVHRGLVGTVPEADLAVSGLGRAVVAVVTVQEALGIGGRIGLFVNLGGFVGEVLVVEGQVFYAELPVGNGLIDHRMLVGQDDVVLNASKKADGSVLVSTYGKGVIEIDSRGNVRQIYTKDNSFLKDDHVYATLYDKDGGLWIGSLNGDLVYSPVSQISQKQAECRNYPVHDVQAITQLTSGQIVVGTAFGLKLITPGSAEVKELDYTPAGVTDVNPFVTHLLASGMELWIATDGGGVYVYHLGKHVSRQITTTNGLPSNYVRSLVKSRDGRIWIATDEGLAFVKSGEGDKVINANYCYGFNREYSRGAAQVLPDGDIVFGSTTGAIIIHPENVQPLNYTASITFVGVNCDVDSDKLQNTKVFNLLNQGRLSLSYRQRTFDLQFESVNMRNHFDIVYRYKMGRGEWSKPTDQQYIRFVNLEPGEHQLTLQCLSRTTGTVLDSKTLIITIAQPWWSSWWMWCIYIALVLLAFYTAWQVYKLHEKYMRLTIDHLKATNASTPASVPAADEPEEVQVADSDEAESDFVDKATQLISEHLSDTDYSIDSLCREMAMSRTLFYVKLKSFTGKSPQDFIRIIRLERAAQMLRNGRSVSDAATLAGFENAKYFSTVFKKYFGVSPSKYK